MNNYTNFGPEKKYPRPSIDHRLQAGCASDYIRPAADEIKPGDRVVLCVRVSGYVQNRNGNLADQKESLGRKADLLGAEVVGVVTHVGSGADPYWLGRAVAIAKEKGAMLFAETTDRFIRHPAYHPKNNPDAQARETELRELAWWASGTVLVTDLPPDASPREVRSYHRKRGQHMKGNRGGRPVKRRWKARRLTRSGLARKMRDDGLSYQQVADRLNESNDGFTIQTSMTIYNWLHRGI